MTSPYGRKWRRTKQPLDESERGEWKSWLKTQCLKNKDRGIWSHHFMANRWENNENSERLYFLNSKITADGDCSHEIKRRLLLGRKAVTNLDSIKKSRDITLPTKFHLVKAMVFPGVMYGCESWTINKAECQRIDAFELWCWRRLLSPLNCKEIQPVNPKGNQSWIFIGRTDAEAETPILGPPDAKNQLIWKDPDAGKDWRREEKVTTGWGGWMASLPQCTWVWACSRSWWWTGKSGVQQSMGSQRAGHDWASDLSKSTGSFPR